MPALHGRNHLAALNFAELIRSGTDAYTRISAHHP
jgi:hypothetical protein